MTTVTVTDHRPAQVGSMPVRRLLPRRGRRSVSWWCFADHMGPADGPGMSIGPHPHIGLQTVTWLVEGELVHRDSVGSEQPIRPGQLNLMTAGRGVSHSEEAVPGWSGRTHGIQLWVAQPDATRWGDPAFEHHAELPSVELGAATATLLVGPFAGASSPARRDTDHLAAEVELRAGTTEVEVDAAHEHGIIPLEGALTIFDTVLEPGQLGHVAPGSPSLAFRSDGPARALVLGGVPMEDDLVMWWNFVARSHDEVSDAYVDWSEADPRFGTVDTALDRIPTDPPPWLRP